MWECSGVSKEFDDNAASLRCCISVPTLVSTPKFSSKEAHFTVLIWVREGPTALQSCRPRASDVKAPRWRLKQEDFAFTPRPFGYHNSHQPGTDIRHTHILDSASHQVQLQYIIHQTERGRWCSTRIR